MVIPPSAGGRRHNLRRFQNPWTGADRLGQFIRRRWRRSPGKPRKLNDLCRLRGGASVLGRRRRCSRLRSDECFRLRRRRRMLHHSIECERMIRNRLEEWETAKRPHSCAIPPRQTGSCSDGYRGGRIFRFARYRLSRTESSSRHAEASSFPSDPSRRPPPDSPWNAARPRHGVVSSTANSGPACTTASDAACP